MAWEWSHTPEAYANVGRNIMSLPEIDLHVIYAEREANGGNCRENSEWDEVRYAHALDEARGKSLDWLAGYIMRHAEELRTCDNGGFQAWVCPYGCHTVSFDHEGGDE